MKKENNIFELLDLISQVNKIPLFLFNEEGEVIYSSSSNQTLIKMIQPFKKWYFNQEIKNDYFICKLTFLELYFAYSFSYFGQKRYLFGGPSFLYINAEESNYKNYSFKDDLSFEEFQDVAKTFVPCDLFVLTNVLRLVIGIINGKVPPTNRILNNSKEFLHDVEQDKFEKIVSSLKKDAIERARYTHNDEIKVLNMVRQGDLEAMSETPQIVFSRVTSIVKNELKNALYLGIALVTLVCRAAIDGGFSTFDAYSKSDHYILKLDNATSVLEMSVILKQMLYDYTYEVFKSKNMKKYSHNINQAIIYINQNYQSDISLETIASHVGLNPKYLSRLFLKEVGVKITDFIKNLKIEEAKNLLVYTDEGYSSITYKLNFPSQSYFVEVFKKETGFTPKSYRDHFSKIL